MIAVERPSVDRPIGRSHSELDDTTSRPAKIRSWHTERLAIVYVRQSSPYQVMHNKESAEFQAKLRDLAIAWGWDPSRVVVIDDDQARSGTSVEGRSGIQWIVDEVNLDHVGIILGFQVSRLSRANSDWYHLLERCGVFHTLLADQDGLYDPMQYNDRFLLGMKGTMTEAELHFMRQRLYHGRLNKARRGALFTSAPIGYVRARTGDRLELDPDEQAQRVVRLVFDKFDELGSVGAVLRHLVHNDIKLPVRAKRGEDAGQLEWHPAVRPTLNKIFRHPIYAGCYVFGMSHLDPRKQKPGRPGTGIVQVERLKWDIMIPNQVPAYITWERYLANQERLAANRCLPSAVGVPRRGPSFLSGLVYCGRCGRRMRVAYHAAGTPVYYLCNARAVECVEPICQSLAGRQLEALVADQVLGVLEPASLELSLSAMADLDRQRQQLDQHWKDRLERAEIETHRAARQYHATEPENRLVARELERRWEEALRAYGELKEQYDRFLAATPQELTHADRHRVEALAADIPALWHAAETTIEDRQAIVRCLVKRITVAVRGRTEWVDVTIEWAGGVESRHEVQRTIPRYDQLSNYKALRDRMIALHQSGSCTAEIAAQLNQEGFHPPKDEKPFSRHMVNRLLTQAGLLGPGRARRVGPEDLLADEWRLSDLARELTMSAQTLRQWYSRGWVTGRRVGKYGCWILWADGPELDRLRRLRAWRRGGHNRKRPRELTTPGRAPEAPSGGTM